MGFCQSTRNLRAVPQHFRNWKRALLDAGRERLTLDIFHHEVIRPHIVQGANVRMIQRGDGSGLAFQAFAELPSVRL